MVDPGYSGRINEQEDINVLLLGETGVGKSTLINALANYFSFNDLEEAKNGEPLILIPATITVTDVEYENHTFNVGSAEKNEYQEIGASATQNVRTFVFPIGLGNIRLRLIDSPGMGDTRGIKKDDFNCDNILYHISQLKQLHAICILTKPSNSRITVLFEYCFKQILSRLEKSASENIVFIFTNAKGSDYGPGDSFPVLKKMVEDIKRRSKIDIPFKRNIFCLDNEAFKYLAAIQKGVKFSERQVKSFTESWDISHTACWRLIAYILGDENNAPLKPHQLTNTVCINEARKLIVQLCQPLAEITQLIFDNIRILERHQQNLLVENQSIDDLKDKLHVPIVNLKVVQLQQPVTVCTSLKCSEFYQVANLKKWHYRQRCHDPCYLDDVAKEVIGDPGLVNCAAMDSNVCVECGCYFDVHMHIYYETETVDDEIVDDTVKANLDNKLKVVEEAKKVIAEIEQRKKEYDEERDIVNKVTAQFAYFLQNNAITPYNDSYHKYINYLIEREKGLGSAADEIQIKALEKMLKEYEEEKRAFETSLELIKNDNTISDKEILKPQDIFKGIQTLYSLKHTGGKIRQLLDTQKKSREMEYERTCEYVHPKIRAKPKKTLRQLLGFPKKSREYEKPSY